MTINRRKILLTAATTALAAPFIRPGIARAAEFSYKIANNQPLEHPSNVRLQEAVAAILDQTGGSVDIQIFPSNQLGADTDVLGQLRAGGVEFFQLSPIILSTLVPNASINGVGFAFPDYDTVWKAMDGELGAYERGQIENAGLIVMDKIWITASGRRHPRPSPSPGPPIWRASRSACRSARCGRRFTPPLARRRPRSTLPRSIRRCRPALSTGRKIRWPS